MDATLSPALTGDAAAIAALVEAAYCKYVTRIGARPGPMLDDYKDVIAHHVVHVARSAGGIVGVIVLIEKEGGILLDNIAVSPEAQGRGLGGRLLDLAEAEALGRGYRRLDLYTHEMMTENLEIYRRRGFVETGRRTEHGFPRVYMAKELDPGVRP
jgi:ribosomal protein S18 acetylase RimI-like enzyme